MSSAVPMSSWSRLRIFLDFLQLSSRRKLRWYLPLAWQGTHTAVPELPDCVMTCHLSFWCRKHFKMRLSNINKIAIWADLFSICLTLSQCRSKAIGSLMTRSIIWLYTYYSEVYSEVYREWCLLWEYLIAVLCSDLNVNWSLICSACSMSLFCVLNASGVCMANCVIWLPVHLHFSVYSF